MWASRTAEWPDPFPDGRMMGMYNALIPVLKIIQGKISNN